MSAWIAVSAMTITTARRRWPSVLQCKVKEFMTRIVAAKVFTIVTRFSRIIPHIWQFHPLRNHSRVAVARSDRLGKDSHFPLKSLANVTLVHLDTPEPRIQWTIHDPHSWSWTSTQIQSYLQHQCLHPPITVTVNDQYAMLQLYAQIIEPCCEIGLPFVPVARNPTVLNYLTVSNGHGSQIPITDFYTAMGWIISMVESRTSAPADYCKLLATYAKWCYTIWRDLFPRTCVPTTASIKVVIAGQRQSFWVSTSLPHADLKEAARLVREQYMHALFGRLPEAPIFAEAVKRGGECGHVKWGHCAETLTTMCSYFRVPPPEFVCGVAIKLKPVAKAPEYSQAAFRDAMLEACDNCKIMMKHAKIAYRDWYRDDSW